MILIFDWDETITASDTLDLIAPPEGEQRHGPGFSHYSKAYAADLSEHTNRWPERKTVQAQMDFLASLDVVELASQSRIEEGGLFKDAPSKGIKERALRVKLRDGWEDVFVPWLKTACVESHIISVGWSAVFIRTRLAQSLPPDIPLTICANEVETLPATEKCTGKLTKSMDASPNGRSGIRTGLDKLREMRRIVDDAAARRGTSGPVLYIGDSNTDLPCLLEADVGIIMGESQSLRRTCSEIGIEITSVSMWRSQRGLPFASPNLVHAKGWADALHVVQMQNTPIAP